MAIVESAVTTQLRLSALDHLRQQERVAMQTFEPASVGCLVTQRYSANWNYLLGERDAKIPWGEMAATLDGLSAYPQILGMPEMVDVLAQIRSGEVVAPTDENGIRASTTSFVYKGGDNQLMRLDILMSTWGFRVPCLAVDIFTDLLVKPTDRINK